MNVTRSGIKNQASAAAYGLLGMPLAMAALPIYVQIPLYYSDHLGLGVAITGWVLFLARLVDTVQDPFLGRWIDGLSGQWHAWFYCGAVFLSLAFWGLWSPPIGYADQLGLAVWLALMLIVAYTGHSMLNIAYLTWGTQAEVGYDRNTGMLGLAGWREGAGLIGVILASVVPTLIMNTASTVRPIYLVRYSLFFALILLFSVVVLFRFAPRTLLPLGEQQPQFKSSFVNKVDLSQTGREMKHILQNNARFRRLLWPYFLNAISVAIPSTLALFFINDRLQAPERAAAFFASYFLAAAIGLPLWVKLAKKTGALKAWRLGMILSILSFCSAVTLGAGDVYAYFLICVTAGLALGSDLALPPVLLANVIDDASKSASYFGIWTLLGKLALAVSGLALPLLAGLGYQPGVSSGVVLALVYAGVPCILKLMAWRLLAKVEE